MSHYVRTPGAGTPRALEIVNVGTTDDFQIAHRPAEIHKQRLRRRLRVSAHLAELVVSLAGLGGATDA